MSEKKYLTVTALTRYIKTKLENDPHLHTVFLKGEISNFKHHGRGHMYFTLKDANAKIPAVMFSGQNKLLKFKVENGMTVLVQGEISLYEPSGMYQIYVKSMEPDGIGALYLAYEQLKEKLAEEGLFSSLHKKPIPTFPKKIAVVTSPTGAAVRDILTTIKRRYPIAKVLVFPTLVQGANAAQSIVKSIETANKMEDIDVIIAGRGGGSIEELWSFNEEIVARAIFQSKVPIISAVGHETDVTIADFVADLRAATPTGAAEMAVPNIAELSEKVQQKQIRLHLAIKERLGRKKAQLEKLQNAYAFKYPTQICKQKEIQLDRLIEKLQMSADRLVHERKSRLEKVTGKLAVHQPKHRLELAKATVSNLEKNLERAMKAIFMDKQREFAILLSKLEGESPLKIMGKGYSLIYNEKQQMMKSVADTKVGATLTLQLQDGKILTEVVDIIEGGEEFAEKEINI